MNVKFLIPLGLLGLLGIVALILIYIIKPNFQQKLLSSTFLWRLSLKFKKKKIPLSRLRNILLIACQVLIITAIAAILAKTIHVLKEKVTQPEVVLVIDSSASMRAGTEESTRYERAVEAAVRQAGETFDRDGIVSVILAGNDNRFLVERAYADSRDSVVGDLRALLDGETECTYSSSDLSSAVALSDRILSINPSAKTYVYTDKNYAQKNNVELVNVADRSEWNAAILSATADFEDNYYTFRIEVVCYGRDLDLGVNLEVFGVNAASSDDTTAGNLSLEESVPCASDQAYTLIFKYFPDENYTDAVEAYEKTLPENAVFHLLGSGEGITSYQSVHISLSVNGDAVEDSVSLDNSFDIYDGLKERIRIQYCSSGQDPLSGEKLGPNVFFQEVLAALKKNYEAKWDFDITEVKRGQVPALEGYDFYIFEHSMPEKLPADGVILLVDPLGTPSGAGFRVENLVDMSKKSVYLAQEETHPILNNIEATNITVSRYLKVSYDPEYSMLLSYAGDPLLLVRNDEDAQVAVMCFSLHYSNLPLLKDFPLMMRNLFEYFFPSTVDGNSFETEQTVSVNCRGDELTVKGYDTDLTLTQFPAQLKLSLPGSYRLSQTTRAGKAVSTTVYVRVPRAESDIFAEEGVITGPYYEVDESDYYQDLLLYLAGALVFLLLLEWYLQHKESSI